MADAYVDKVANELADLALADQDASGDVGIVDSIGEVLGASSQTLQETYLTAIRVRRAERRARQILAERASRPIVPLAELIEDQTPDDDHADIEEAEVAPEPEVETPKSTDAAPDADAEAKTESTPSSMPRRVTR